MAAPQEVYAANSGSSSGRSWAQPANQQARQNRVRGVGRRFGRETRFVLCLCYDPADFFAQRRLVCSSETTYVSRQSDAEGRAWIQKRDTDSLQGSAAREGTVGLH